MSQIYSPVYNPCRDFFKGVDIRDRDERNELLDRYENEHGEDDGDPFDKYDDEFYDLYDSENEGFGIAAGKYLWKNLDKLPSKLSDEIKKKII